MLYYVKGNHNRSRLICNVVARRHFYFIVARKLTKTTIRYRKYGKYVTDGGVASK